MHSITDVLYGLLFLTDVMVVAARLWTLTLQIGSAEEDIDAYLNKKYTEQMLPNVGKSWFSNIDSLRGPITVRV